MDAFWVNPKTGSKPWYHLTNLSKKEPIKGPGSVSSKSSTKVPEAAQLLPRCDFCEFCQLDTLVTGTLKVLKGSSIASSSAARQASYSICDISERVDCLNRIFPENRPVAENARLDVAKRMDTLGGHVRKCVNEAPVSSFVEEFARLSLQLLKRTEEAMFSLSEDQARPLQNICCFRAADMQLSTAISAKTEQIDHIPAQPSEGATDANGAMTTAVPAKPNTQLRVPVFSLTITPDIEVLDGNGLTQRICFPLAFIEAKKPAFDLATSFEGALPPSQRLKKMVDDNVKGPGSITPLLLAISQALFYSPHSVSRCVALCEFNNVIFLEVVFTDTFVRESAQECRVKVNVSNIYDRTAVVGAFVGFYRYLISLKLEKLDEDALLLFAKSLRVNEKDGKRNSSKKKANNAKSSPSDERTMGSVSDSAVNSDQAGSSATAKKQALNCQVESPLSVVSSASTVQFASRLEPHKLHHMIDHHVAQLDSSDIHFVLISKFDGDGVVIKFAKSLDDIDTADSLSHELKSHESLHRMAGDRYGDTVSRLFSYGSVPEYGLVLVTLFVGAVLEQDHGNFFINGSPIQDTAALSSTALRILRVLHSYDVCDGDIVLRNLRAMRLNETQYRVWWIDIGLGSVGCNVSSKEILECEALFTP